MRRYCQINRILKGNFTAMKRNNVLVDLFTLLLYISIFLIGSESLNSQLFSLLSAASAFMIAVISLIKNNGVVHTGLTTKYFLWIFCFMLFCYCSAIWAIEPDLALTKGNSIAKNGLCIMLLYMYYGELNNIKHLLKVVMYGGYSVVLLTVLFFGMNSLTDILAASVRLNSSFLNQNMLGMLAAFTIIINLYFVLYYHEEKKAMLFGVASLIVLAAAGSRKSIIELFMGVILLCITKNYSEKKSVSSLFKVLIVVTLACFAGYFVIQLPMFSFINMRFENLIHQLTGSGYADYSVRTRASLNELGMKLFSENPILGIGMDCSRIPAKNLTGRDYYLHNNFIELLADGGVIGFILFYSIYALLFYRMIKLRKYRDAEYDISLILMLIHVVLGYAYVSYYNRETYFYLLIYFMETEILKRKNLQNDNEYQVRNGSDNYEYKTLHRVHKKSLY